MKDQNISYSKDGFTNLLDNREHELIITSGLINLLDNQEFKKKLDNIIVNYFNCDWQLSNEDKEINFQALSRGGNVFSSYQINGLTINILTDRGWNQTTVMLSDEN